MSDGWASFFHEQRKMLDETEGLMKRAMEDYRSTGVEVVEKKADSTTYRIKASNWRIRRRLGWTFFRVSMGILFKGRATLKVTHTSKQ